MERLQKIIFVLSFSECPSFYFGVECAEICQCIEISTESCDPVSGRCTCKAGWEGVTCATDLDECSTSSTDRCTGELEKCVNTEGSFQCECTDAAAKDATGKCIGECPVNLWVAWQLAC